MLKNIKDMGWIIPSGLVYTEEGNSVKIKIPNDATIGTKYTIKYSNNSCSKSVTVTVSGNINCNPTDNPALNKFLTGGTGHGGFNKCVKDGLSITASENGGTKCTYTLLDMVYKAATANTSTNNDTAIAWALAEMLTELTPSGKSSTKYFVEANTYGDIPDLITNENVYNNRLNGAIVYTKLRYDKFNEITAMAAKSRDELTSKGVTEAKLISPPGYSDRDINVVAGGKTYNYKYKSFNFPRNSIIDVVNYNLVPDKTTEHTISDITATDKNKMLSILIDKETDACSDGFKKAYYDNFFCSARLYEILNGKITDYDNLGIWLKFYDDAKDPQDAILNGLKYKRTEGRLRPMGQIVGTDPKLESEISADRVTCQDCDDANFRAEVERVRKLCDDTDTCQTDLNFEGDKHSYPSGHSGKAYIAGLAYLEATGKNMMSRIDDYAFNRSIVRAHWVSDTIAGKVLASMAIGVLNGTKEFLDEVSAIRGDTPTPPEPTTDCYCDASGTYNGISAMYRKEGSGGLAVPVGYIDLARGCTSLTPKCTSIICRENTCSDGSEVIASTSDVTFQENYEGHDWGVFAIIKENTQGSMRRVRIYFNCLNTSESADPGELNYINFFQAG